MAPKAKPAAKPAAKAAVAAKVGPEYWAAKKAREQPKPEDLIPKVAWPSKEEFDEKTKAVQDEIDKLQEKQKALAKQINERSGGKDEYQQKRQELRHELDHWSAQLDEIRAKKDTISQALGQKKAESMEMKGELSKMKKSIGFTSETEIDQRIASIEFKMWTESVTLRDEKKMLAEISELKKNRPKVAGVKKLEDSLGSDDKGASLRDQSKALSEQMGRLLEEKKKVSVKLTELMENRKQETGPMQELIEERESLSQKVRELSGKRNEIRGEYRQAEKEYYAYQAEVRKIKQERAAEDRLARQKEYEDLQKFRKAEKLDEQPYTNEITLVEQTIAFCKALTKEKETAAKEEKKEIVHNLDGVEVMASKKDRDEDLYFVPSKAKKGKSKSGAAKAEGGSTKPIKHTAETFQLFAKLKLDAPINTADVPNLLEKLEEQLKDYKDKVSEWTEKKEEMKKRILEGKDEEEAKEVEKEEEKAEE